jgi:EAL domain-containing protein (putative c-di-GMP-specific phosphodiesterase class I)
MASAGASSSIVQAVVNIAAASDMTTTAEGVETEEQMRCLNLEGCSEVQGYLYSRPVPGDQVAKLLASLNARRELRRV